MATQNRNEVTITRIFDAPRELVWKAWTDPETFKRWFGPKTYTTPIARMDLRVGGKFFSSMRSSEGQEMYSTGVYRVIVEPEKLVMTDSFADEDGNVVPPSHYGMSESVPEEMLITATFEEHEGKTKFTLAHSGIEGMDDENRKGMEQGWSESFDKLEKVLESEKEKLYAR